MTTGRKILSRATRLLLGSLLGLSLAAGAAQAQYSDRYEFIKAIKEGDANTVISKLNNGIFPDVRDGDGTPALMVAVQHGGAPWVALLLKNGADPNVTNRSDGKTVLMYFAERGDVDGVKLMLAKGANVNLADSFGETALIKAARNRQYRAAKQLVEAHAKIDLQDRSGNTALDHAVNSRDRRLEKLLQDALDNQGP